MENNPKRMYKDSYEDEIDLYKSVQLLLKNKKTILWTMVLTGVIALAMSIFVLKPIYQADLEFELNIPATVLTKYGEFIPNINSNQELANIISEDEAYLNIVRKLDASTSADTLKSMITIIQDPSKPHELGVRIKSTNQEDIRHFLEVLPVGYETYLDNKIQKEYLKYFKKYYETEIYRNENELQLTKELLSNAKIMSNLEQKFLNNTNEVNPNWVKAQGYILDYQKKADELNIYIQIGKKQLELIEMEKRAMQNSVNNEFKSNIMIMSTIGELQVNEIFSKVALNTVMGLISGLIISVCYVFFKEWWLNSRDTMETKIA